MRSGSNLIILVIAVLMGGAAAFLAREWLASHVGTVAVVEPQTGTIVVASASLSYGTPITPDTVTEISWPSKVLPDGAFASVQDLVKDGRRVVLTPFVRNEPIVASKITQPGQKGTLSTTIEEGKRAVTVPVDDVRGVAGFIFPGDFVDVALTRANGGGANQNYSEVILQHVKVLAIDQTAGERQDRPTVARAVTLELSSGDALKILLATNVGHLSLILRQAAEPETGPNERITERDLYPTDSPPSDLLADVAPSRAATSPPAAPPPAPVASAPTQASDPAPPKEPTTRTVTIVRGLKGEDYEVPKSP
jgi:pilus assembly protein CpaB